MEDATTTPPQDGSRTSLLYTVAFDPPGAVGARHMAKMLGSSVVRTLFSGHMMIFHNSPAAVFMAGRPGIEEIPLETLPMDSQMMAQHARTWKAKAAESIDAEPFAWVVFLDADCLCLRNIEHLLTERDCDILYQPETGRALAEGTFNGYLTDGEMDNPPLRWGINAGTWAVRGTCYQAVMKEWTRIQFVEPVRDTENREQSAWNRLIADAAQHGWRAEPFEAHEIQLPFGADKNWRLYKDAAIVHCSGGTPKEKLDFMFGLYVQQFFSDPAWSLLNLVET